MGSAVGSLPPLPSRPRSAMNINLMSFFAGLGMDEGSCWGFEELLPRRRSLMVHHARWPYPQNKPQIWSGTADESASEIAMQIFTLPGGPFIWQCVAIERSKRRIPFDGWGLYRNDKTHRNYKNTNVASRANIGHFV